MVIVSIVPKVCCQNLMPVLSYENTIVRVLFGLTAIYKLIAPKFNRLCLIILCSTKIYDFIRNFTENRKKIRATGFCCE